MKTHLWITSAFICFASSLWAQSTKIIRVKDVTDLRKAVPMKDQYKYPAFKTGTVSLHNGTAVEAKLNYNLLLKAIQFIDPKGDTMNLSNEFTIKQIVIDQDQFIHHPKTGFLVFVDDHGSFRLAAHQMLIQVGNDKMGAYDQSSGASSITAVKSFMDPNGRVQNLDIKGDVLLTREEEFFLVDKNNVVYPASKASVLRFFPNHKKEINGYVKEKKTNFKEKDELVALLNFSKSLTIN
ncbi:hypothetical protein [Telluribacter sp.]|jgi:hypothetical protein|uniref:hypothetical protein n=1 Tax=Telluribacter sp. TaxID=1978767 RepID=UPI002E15CB4B|nr:hypothetical protein [Telluribacter sp.]